MQSFSLGKRRKKRDGWLMTFTWLVLFVVIGLSGAWWWQDHKAQQEEITTMADQSSAELSSNSEQGQSVPLNTSTTTDPATTSTPPASVDTTATNTQTPAVTAPAPAVDPQQNAVVSPSQANVDTAATPAPTATTTPDGAAPLPTDQAAPYKLKIGAPAAVQIQYQGKPVDLSRFIRTNQVARLTLNAEQSPAQ